MSPISKIFTNFERKVKVYYLIYSNKKEEIMFKRKNSYSCTYFNLILEFSVINPSPNVDKRMKKKWKYEQENENKSSKISKSGGP